LIFLSSGVARAGDDEPVEDAAVFRAQLGCPSP
jgi:hypothetical protein